MNHTIRRIFTCSLSLFCLVTAASAQWTPPTPEELQITSQSEVPGAPAVYLYREEITDDAMHNWSKYVRLKVLTERGKEYANVELSQYSAQDDEGFNRGFTVGDIQGRTIHPDGTIIPFTGKPFEKLVEKGQGFKETAKVFTLPDVEVGSIIEYRYRLRYDDNLFFAPSWFIQSELFTRKAHYIWKPTSEQLVSKDEKGEQLTSAVAWAPILPPGVTVKQTRLPGSGYQDGQLELEVNVQGVPPVPDEDYMPPIKSLSYRVLFYYSPYHTIDEYWKNQGKGWSKNTDKFVGPGSKVVAAVHDLVAESDTPEQKLRKLYAAVMRLDNSSYNRSRSAAEEKAQGLGPAKTTDDIWERKRGGDDQLADLFVAMARGAGFKAYVMTVTARDRSLFNINYLSFSQFDDHIAIVNVDGKDQFFDPGQRYCPYGHLAWKHTMVQGLRQMDGGNAVIAVTPAESYKDSHVERIADLTLDEHGEATGTLKFSWTGAPALRWRQVDLRTDDTAMKHDLQTAVEHMMPGGMEVKVSSIVNLSDYEQPLVVTFNVKGAIGSATGKRLIVPGDIFEANSSPTFPHEKREVAVCFDYPIFMQDAMRITYPPSMALESQPTPAELPYQQVAHYSMSAKTAPHSVTVFRNFLRGEIIFPPKEYPDLRAYFNKFETKDQEPIVLKAAEVASGN